MTAPLCVRAGCGTPAPRGLCVPCRDLLVRLLLDVGPTLADLALAHSRLVNYSAGSSDAGDGAGLPFNEGAGAIAKEYAGAIVSWQGKYADHLRIPVRWITAVSAALWISQSLTKHGLGTWVEAGRMVEALLALEKKTRAQMDRGATEWYAGPCSGTVRQTDGEPRPCTALLYAPREYGEIKCRRCGATYAIEERRRYLLSEVGLYRLTAAEAARAIVVLTDYERGESKLVDRIRKWEARKRIVADRPVLVHGRERKTYLVADILQLLDLDGYDTGGLDRVTAV